MILKTKLWGVVCILAISFLGHSQTYLISDGGTISTCSGTIYDSGGAGGSYSPNENYTTSFCAPPGQCISITFATAPDFGPDSGNPRDRIVIYDGPTTAYANLGSLNANSITGLTFPFTVTSTSGCLTLKFISNSDATVGNFEASISCGACPVQPEYDNPNGFVYTCNATFFDHRGPGGNYANNVTRTTKFCSADGSCVRVTFNSFSTESGFDYLDIYDGSSTSDPLIGSYSGSSSPGVVTASSGCLTFRFTSDVSNRDAGWDATVECVPCGTPPPPSQQNCNGGVTVCSDQAINGNSSGSGSITDLNSSNDGCLYGENQTTWWYFSPSTSGTVAFTIDPVNNSDDYDFAIWGPLGSVTCPPAATPVRCSYSALSDQTGLNASASDNTEDSFGDSFVAPLNVLANEVYVLVVDNYSETFQPYNLNWNLTNGATLNCTPLPVNFVDFFGYNKGIVNELSWTTASEFNNDYFTIERSKDETKWTKIATVYANGTTLQTSNYSLKDYSFERNALNYYRLTQYDIDGKKTELKTIVIKNDNLKDTPVRILNLLGQEVDKNYKGYVLKVYENGDVIKSFQ